MNRPVVPAPLRPGDTVAILSPASAVDPLLIEGAANALARLGYRPRVMPHAAKKLGSYSAAEAERLADLRAAMADPDVKALLCSRGGYGAVHLLGQITPRPVWLIGFSDISALHALWHTHGIASVHGSMARHLALFPPDDPANRALAEILATGRQPAYEFDPHPLNRPGTVSGSLLGGNLAVLSGLLGTPMSLLKPDTIMVIEDIAEPIYKVERILHQLRLAGILPNLRGLIVGQFTEWEPDRNYSDMNAMIADMIAPYDYPAAFNVPFGHVDTNLPFIESSTVTLAVTPATVSLAPPDLP
ncbi:MAG: LD-carboxypeptidase [Muribaculaceae bacterium]|nr:LD-carboxypeptidase [Muribaculaceae bacterium]